jgi:hypothetical protein
LAIGLPNRALGTVGADPHFYDLISERTAASARYFCRDAPQEPDRGSGVRARVMAPRPWFPFGAARFGRYAAFAQIPSQEIRHGLHIDHPRYLAVPKIGMSAAPLPLSAATLPLLRRQLYGGQESMHTIFIPTGWLQSCSGVPLAGRSW